MRNLRPICPGGEIGRRDSFRFYWIHVLVGSSPVPGTLFYFPSLRGCLFLIRKHRHAFDFFLHKIANCCFRNRSTDLGRLVFLVGSSSVAKQSTATYTKKNCPTHLSSTHNTHQHEKNEGRTTSNSCHAPLSLLKINQKAFKLIGVSMPSN